MKEKAYDCMFALLCVVPNTIYLIALVPIYLISKGLEAKDRIMERVRG